MNEQRKPYNEESRRTLPLLEGRTIKTIRTANSARTNEFTGLIIEFTDGTEVTVRAEVVDNGSTGRDNGPDAALDVARSTGLYFPSNPRKSFNAAGEEVELS